MSLFAVIADDLTGAGDTGVQFSIAGFKTRIFLQMSDINIDSTRDVDVVVVTTDSRAVDPIKAYNLVEDASLRLRDVGVKNIYKKIDSTLRGNIGQEIDAIIKNFDFELALISPSFPANGRVVIGGYLLVNNEIVSRTSFANDPTFPVKESNIISLLSQQSHYNVVSLPISLVSQGPEAISLFLKEKKKEEVKLVVADTLSDQDLTNVVIGGGLSGLKLFYVGSAGLALPVAHSWISLRQTKSRQIILLVCGSINPKAIEQVDFVSQKPGWRTITIDPVSYIKDQISWKDSLIKELREITASDDIEGVVLTVPHDHESIDKIKANSNQLGISPEDLPKKIALALSQATLTFLDITPVKGFIITGGDTATAVMNILGGKGLDLFSEVSPGIPIGRMVGGKYNQYPVITKAGGFGGREALWEAVKKMRAL
jgi:uncharacterized protein YgbK (DUF1537 family)